MAITIQQSPTNPNTANNTLLFAVTSNSSSAPQYQFVCDICYSGSAVVLQRIKQQPNPNATGIFDVGSIITNYLESDNNWKAAPFSTSSFVGKRFSIKFGEQYGTSVSSSVTLYTGNAAVTGSPAVTASAYNYFFYGVTDPYDKVNWNFPSQSYYTSSGVSTTTTFSKQHALTNAPYTQSIQDGEYATISLINGNFTNSTTAAQDIYAVRVRSYDATGSLLDDVDLSNLISNGGGPRANGTQVWSAVAANQTAGTQLLTVGIGPQNLADNGDTLNANWAYYTVEAVGQQSAGVANYSGSYASYRFVKQGAQCGYDGVRFAFKNDFGVWDYYTFTLQTDASYNIERVDYVQSFVPYSANTTATYDKERRGRTDFYNNLSQNLVANSDWLTQEEADWLKELFFSANVFQQVGNEFFPIDINTAQIVEKTNPRTQKLFQYQIEFEPANQKNPRV